MRRSDRTAARPPGPRDSMRTYVLPQRDAGHGATFEALKIQLLYVSSYHSCDDHFAGQLGDRLPVRATSASVRGLRGSPFPSPGQSPPSSRSQLGQAEAPGGRGTPARTGRGTRLYLLGTRLKDPNRGPAEATSWSPAGGKHARASTQIHQPTGGIARQHHPGRRIRRYRRPWAKMHAENTRRRGGLRNDQDGDRGANHQP